MKGLPAMLIGAHSIIYSKKPEVDRTFFKDVLHLPNLDVGDGWLVFALPPGELAVHPSGKNDVHELYLMCDDIKQFVSEMKTHDIKCSPIQNQSWGVLTELTLPGGGKLGVYQPRHGSPKPVTTRIRKRVVKRSTKKSTIRTRRG